MQLLNLVKYEPENPVDSVIYLRDETGLDWYESQNLFTKKYKIIVDGSGLVRSCAEDISSLWPLNGSVYETDILPNNFEVLKYKYIDCCFVATKDYAQEARFLRNKIRLSIDLFLQPASTISDQLITEEQKATLIQDSLALAKWPAQAGWPYIGLPILSDLCKSLLSIPVWEYPTQEVS